MKLRGSWEQRGRNPLVGAAALVVGLGAAYFLVQSLALYAYVLIELLRNAPAGGAMKTSIIEDAVGMYRGFRPAILVVLAATQTLVFLLPVLLIIPRWHTAEVGRYLRFRRFTPAGLLLAVAGTLSLLPLAMGLAQWLYSFFPELARWNQAVEALIVDPRPGPILATLLVIGAVPAVCEEVLFRGYFQSTLERRLKAPWPFLVSGAVFALFHQQLLSLPSLLLVGLYLGYLLFRFRSIYLTMLCHFLHNALLILLANFPAWSSALFKAEGGRSWPWLAGAAALFLGVIVGMEQVYPRRE